MSKSSHSLFYIIAVIFCAFAVPMMTTAHNTSLRVERELEMARQTLGADYAYHVQERADSWFRAASLDRRLQPLRADEDEREEQGWAPWIPRLTTETNGWLASFIATAYQALMRLSIMISFLPYLFPFFLGVIMHATAYRQVRMADLEYQSPFLFGAAQHLLLFLVGFPLLYLVLPISLNPLILPFWAIGMALPLMTVIEHAQRLTR